MPDLEQESDVREILSGDDLEARLFSWVVHLVVLVW
jgi:hypothetical protein